MRRCHIILSPNEQEVMDLLWLEGRALTRGEIIELSPERSWKTSTIHLLLNSLLKKEMIKVDGFKQTGKNYGRTFTAAMTREAYTARELMHYLPKSTTSKQIGLAGVFAALVADTQLDSETLDELQHVLDEKKRKLKE